MRQFRLDWTDVRAVRHRTEVYQHRSPAAALAAGSLCIETAGGSDSSSAATISSDLEPVLIELAHRADRPWCEDDEVKAGLLRTLRHGAPAVGQPPVAATGASDFAWRHDATTSYRLTRWCVASPLDALLIF